MSAAAVAANDPAAVLCRHFLGWQCRLRQHAVRHDGGRPAPGMRPRVLAADGTELAAAVTVLLVPREPAESTALFRHQMRRTHDPAQRYQKALETLSAAFYQHPDEFSDRLTALFAGDSPLAATLAESGRCTLDFVQYNQRYTLPCTVAVEAAGGPAYEATYWHNALFNPRIPDGLTVLAFAPDWAAASADPPATS
jgi:hypothetical protein